MIMKVTLDTKISDHPLDKIFRGIPARSADIAHASVMHRNKDLSPCILDRSRTHWTVHWYLSNPRLTGKVALCNTFPGLEESPSFSFRFASIHKRHRELRLLDSSVAYSHLFCTLLGFSRPVIRQVCHWTQPPMRERLCQLQ